MHIYTYIFLTTFVLHGSKKIKNYLSEKTGIDAEGFTRKNPESHTIRTRSMG